MVPSFILEGMTMFYIGRDDDRFYTSRNRLRRNVSPETMEAVWIDFAWFGGNRVQFLLVHPTDARQSTDC